MSTDEQTEGPFYIVCNTLTGSLDTNTYQTPKGNRYTFFKTNPLGIVDPEDALYFLNAGPKDQEYFSLASVHGSKSVREKILGAIRKIVNTTPAAAEEEGEDPDGEGEDHDPEEVYGLTREEYDEAVRSGTWDEVEEFQGIRGGLSDVKQAFDEYAENTFKIILDRRLKLEDMKLEFWTAWKGLEQPDGEED